MSVRLLYSRVNLHLTGPLAPVPFALILAFTFLPSPNIAGIRYMRYYVD